MFTCEIDETQSCIAGSDTASIFSRSHQLTETDLKTIIGNVKDHNCFSLDEFHWTPKLCEYPTRFFIQIVVLSNMKVSLKKDCTSSDYIIANYFKQF